MKEKDRRIQTLSAEMADFQLVKTEFSELVSLNTDLKRQLDEKERTLKEQSRESQASEELELLRRRVKQLEGLETRMADLRAEVEQMKKSWGGQLEELRARNRRLESEIKRAKGTKGIDLRQGREASRLERWPGGQLSVTGKVRTVGEGNQSVERVGQRPRSVFVS